MDIQLTISLKDFIPATFGFYNYILQERCNENSPIAKHIRIPDANELLQTIENEFEELRKPSTLAGILKILHLTILQTATPTLDLSSFIKIFLAKRDSSVEDHLIATQILYQILSSLRDEFPLDSSEPIKELFQNIPVDNAKLETQYALCSALLIKKFKLKSMAETVWSQILANNSHCLLVHNIDSLVSKCLVYERSNFWRLIETLLSSESRDDRKLATFVIRKVLKFLSSTNIDFKVDSLFTWTNESSNQLLTSWATYLTILENLEEKQSHLILPSLETLETVSLGEKTPWIRIILVQMLGHNNTLVLRWSVDFLLLNFRRFVMDNQILREFFHATNNTWLYAEVSINVFELPAFSVDEQKIFLEIFTTVPWKSVPMHVWLGRMKAVDWSAVGCKLVIDVATRLRQLQNRDIRSACRDEFDSLFEKNIANMDLKDFMNFLDAFYSSTDSMSETRMRSLIHKIHSSPQPFISSSVCAMLSDQEFLETEEIDLMNAFDKVKAEDHQWFGILVAFGFVAEDKEVFCERHYGVNWPDREDLSLKDAMNEFVPKLSWDEISKAVVRKATVDWLYSEVDESDYENLLDSGGLYTLHKIASPEGRRFQMKPELLDRLIAELRALINKFDSRKLVADIIRSCNMDQPQLMYKCVNEILDMDVTNGRLSYCVYFEVLKLCDFQTEEGRQLLTRGLLFGEPLTGDVRIELDYLTRIIQKIRVDTACDVRMLCLLYLSKLDNGSNELLKKELIAQSKAMSIKKPRYFENSKHHRIKLRIAQALSKLNMNSLSWDDYYLFAILNENNQPNVTQIYEFIVASSIPEPDLMEQMKSLTVLSTSSQSSMFAISYLFTVYYNVDDEFVENLIALLLPWTMGSVFNTRLYAQITIYHLLQRFQIDGYEYLRISIEQSLKESPSAYEKLYSDVRYNLPKDLKHRHTEAILYATNVPEDEYKRELFAAIEQYDCLKAARELNLSKRDAYKKKETDLSKPVIEDVQRKMNPDMDLKGDHLSEHEVGNTDMIVVASLIDKLPNLGGIARTCEVLGIKNMVMDSAKHAQNKEFKNLSMTAENWINITEVKPSGLLEFLIGKKTEGYEIVGAEQTAKSVNFVEFKFPSKCVLLLGHEKEGIPADLIAFLDYAVEIPQFGMVRSLNVHVTGALFMYEYCKQHLSKINDK